MVYCCKMDFKTTDFERRFPLFSVDLHKFNYIRIQLLTIIGLLSICCQLRENHKRYAKCIYPMQRALFVQNFPDFK